MSRLDQTRSPLRFPHQPVHRVTATILGLALLAVALNQGDASVARGVPSSASTVVQGYETLWGAANPLPRLEHDKQTTPVELGTAFTASKDGVVIALRFYKARGSSGTHVGSLWTSDGKLLARATFKKESASGWQTVRLPEGIPLVKGKSYVVSFFAPKGGFVAARYFDGGTQSTSLSVASGRSGVFTYSARSSFPRDTWHRSQYWADVMFDVARKPSTPSPTGTATPRPTPTTAAPSPDPTTAAPSPDSTTAAPSPDPTTAEAPPQPTPTQSTSPTSPPATTPPATQAPTTPPASAQGFPTRDTTGVPAGWQPSQTIENQDYVVTTDNAVVENLRLINGVLYVRANNVTVRNVELVSARIVNDYNHVCYPVRIEDTSILRGPIDISMPVIESGGYTAIRVKIDGPSEGLRVGEKDFPGCEGGVTIQDSWVKIDTPDDCSDWHGDGIQGYRGGPLTIRNTYINLAETRNCIGTSAFFYPDQENASVVVDHVLLAGGGYVFRLETPGSVTGLKIVDDSWDYGPIDVQSCSKLTAWDAELVTVNGDGTVTSAGSLNCIAR